MVQMVIYPFRQTLGCWECISDLDKVVLPSLFPDSKDAASKRLVCKHNGRYFIQIDDLFAFQTEFPTTIRSASKNGKMGANRKFMRLFRIIWSLLTFHVLDEIP